MKKKVLIADADEKFRTELVAALKETEEFEIIGAAADGQEALWLLQENQPDVLILDLLLPHCDGLTLLDRLPDIRAFIVTGFLSDYILARLEEKPVSGLLKKPCPAQSVADWVIEVLQQTEEA